MCTLYPVPYHILYIVYNIRYSFLKFIMIPTKECFKVWLLCNDNVYRIHFILYNVYLILYCSHFSLSLSLSLSLSHTHTHTYIRIYIYIYIYIFHLLRKTNKIVVTPLSIHRVNPIREIFQICLLY